MKKQLFACLLALAAVATHAGVGLLELPGAGADGPVTVYYPSSAGEQTFQRGPFTLSVAREGTPVRGNGRLVVISHGSGGSPWVHADLARALVGTGFTVALPEHKGDNYKDFTDPGPVSWKLRPGEVSRAIDAVGADPRFGPLLALDRVGIFGGSAGGHTALTMAGGRWSPGAFRRHCEANIAQDFSSCVGYITRLRGNLLDGLKKAVAIGVIRHRFGDDAWYTHTDPRIAAVVAAVPHAATFDMASLATPRVPLGLITAGKDINQVPRFHSDAVRAACRACETVADFPDAAHGVMASPTPPPEKMSAIAQELNGDPPGFNRPAAVATMNRAVIGFFSKHLLP
jgi:predicted dienelactone hydrolase